jgi:hypothetical protein
VQHEASESDARRARRVSLSLSPGLILVIVVAALYF